MAWLWAARQVQGRVRGLGAAMGEAVQAPSTPGRVLVRQCECLMVCRALLCCKAQSIARGGTNRLSCRSCLFCRQVFARPLSASVQEV